MCANNLRTLSERKSNAKTKRKIENRADWFFTIYCNIQYLRFKNMYVLHKSNYQSTDEIFFFRNNTQNTSIQFPNQIHCLNEPNTRSIFTKYLRCLLLFFSNSFAYIFFYLHTVRV